MISISILNWAAGFAVGGAWVFLNFYLLFQLLKIALSQPARKNRIFVLSMLKFPVIYVAGFFILKSRFFPVSGVLTGLTIFFIAMILRRGHFSRA